MTNVGVVFRRRHVVERSIFPMSWPTATWSVNIIEISALH